MIHPLFVSEKNYHALLSEVSQPLYRLGSIVREEQAFALVQLADGLHVFGGKGEVEHIEVLLHALLVRTCRISRRWLSARDW